MNKIIPILALALAFSLLFFERPAQAVDPVSSPSAESEAAVESAAHETEGYSSGQWRDFGWRTANFVVYVLILYFLLRKPVANYFSGRRDKIARTLEYLETQSKNLEEQNQVMRRKLGELSEERKSILAQYEREGAKERDRVISEAHKTAELIVQRAEAAMEAEIKAARRTLTLEMGQLSRELARQKLVEEVTEEDRSRLTADFVSQIIKLPARN
ncbi:MAG: ATP synthase F0 subunit B [Deltaproteobacteria bacterium]|jgi:F-type H+-transporting ATPase subunit b|nr:ATP synthase F0 subunit B [Deltaproteobacteria bacterium]